MQLIAAVDQNWAIGRGSKLLFHIPEDLHQFKALTWGKCIVYGRKTMTTFPGGKPLAGRTNYVLTHYPETLPVNAIGINSLEELDMNCIVVGGASVYEALVSKCNTAYITKVDADGEGDVFFPNLDRDPAWYLAERSEDKTYNGLSYCFCRYQRKV